MTPEAYRQRALDRLLMTSKPDGECLVWTGSTNTDGYGGFHLYESNTSASRAAWVLFFGEIGPGLSVCHHCDNPLCVRPGHLFLGTSVENRADCVRKGRQARGERQHLARLTAESVISIRERWAAGGESLDGLAAAFGVSRSTIAHVVVGRTWKHVGGKISPGRQRRLLNPEEAVQ